MGGVTYLKIYSANTERVCKAELLEYRNNRKLNISYKS